MGELEALRRSNAELAARVAVANGLASEWRERARAAEDERDGYRAKLNVESAHRIAVQQDMDRLASTVVPGGDEDAGYWCTAPGCGAEVDHPFEQRRCAWCGARLDWRTYPEPDDLAYDMWRDDARSSAAEGGDGR